MPFEAFATYDPETGQPTCFQAWMTVDTREEAEAIARSFPKFANVKAGSAGFWKGDELVRGGGVNFQVRFDNKGVQGDRNETGLKRLKAFLDGAGEILLNTRGPMLNAYATLDEFKRAVGLDAPEQTNKP